jgi:hypothetical protein
MTHFFYNEFTKNKVKNRKHFLILPINPISSYIYSLGAISNIAL